MSMPRNTPAPRSRVARPWRSAAALAALLLTGVVAACSDAPSAPGVAAPVAVPSFAKGGKSESATAPDSVWPGEVLATPVTAEGLQRLVPLADTVSATFVVPRAGGVFTVPATGLSILVQPGTVTTDLTLTVKALPGKVVAYEFGPSGTQFPKSLIMVQNLAGTNYDSRVGGTFDVGYFSSLGDIDGTRGTALVKEKLQKYFDPTSATFLFAVNHFSGYMVAWGFSGRN